MDNSTQPEEALMKYLDNELTGPEREEFEKRLAIDGDMRQELENLKTAREAVRMFGLKQKVASIHQEMMTEIKPQGVVRSMSATRRIVRYTTAVAASILLVAVGIIGYNFLRLSPVRLYNSQYHAYELSSLRGEQTAGSVLETDYHQGRYNKVIEDLKSLQNPGPEELFLCGVAYLETGNAPAATTSFKAVIEKNTAAKTTLFNDDAEYYLALSYLRNKQYDQALDLMLAIRNNPNHSYHDQFSRGFVRKVKMLKWR